MKEFRKVYCYEDNEILVQGLNKKNINKTEESTNSISSSESINFIESSDDDKNNQKPDYSNENEYKKSYHTRRFSHFPSKIFINELYTKPLNHQRKYIHPNQKKILKYKKVEGNSNEKIITPILSGETKEQSKEQSKEQTKEQSKEQTKEQSKEQSKEQTKEQTKEQSKEQTKEQTKEQSKEQSKEQTI
jgi:hypothetical protein